MEKSNGDIIIYNTEDGSTKIDVKIENETVWLSQQQIAELYERDISVISRHIKNILQERECTECNLQKMQIPFSDKPIILYDLEIFISS